MPSTRELQRPRRPFVVAFAATLFVAAVTFVEPLQPLTPPELPMLGTTALARGMEIAAPQPLLDSAALERAIIARFNAAPLARVLGRRSREPGVSNRIARAVVREATRLRVEPSLLA